MKYNEIKAFLIMILNLFFQEMLDKTVESNQFEVCPLSR